MIFAKALYICNGSGVGPNQAHGDGSKRVRDEIRFDSIQFNRMEEEEEDYD